MWRPFASLILEYEGRLSEEVFAFATWSAAYSVSRFRWGSDPIAPCFRLHRLEQRRAFHYAHQVDNYERTGKSYD